ncbi:hypothetical protein [Erythrobacter sp. F6033]|uniref:hypothetical protein n=1 Tax=Erythrobacter sp. F6033 TaxID=2926401 RepID=UPI001FF3EC9E|nr:hypothetical protein [Erythrobacter sp. F6033]MCK0128570.1 hypothetical protein [Erythrobacter sp. F6033]
MYYIEFFAFRDEPNVATLEAIDWLTGWRLFEQVDTEAWYLEGPSNEDGITFFEQLQTSSKPKARKIASLSSRILDRIIEEGGDKNLFDELTFLQCGVLSAKLEQPIIHVGGNDEGYDSFIEFDSGKLVGAKCEIDWDRALVIDQDGAMHVERFYPEGTDPDTAKPRYAHDIATRGTAAFFGAETWLISSDPYDFKQSNFRLIAEKGKAPPKIEHLSDVLYKRLGPSPKIGVILAEIEGYVDAALSVELISAENEARFKADEVTGGMSIYASNAHRETKGFQLMRHNQLKAFLIDLSSYTQALRPKPEFRRKDSNLPGVRSSLSMRWRTIKLAAKFLG